MRTMKWYTEGNGVAQLQKALIAAGVLAGPADDRFDWRTRMAVVDFQAREGLVADGIAGPKTLDALQLTTAPPVTQPAPVGMPMKGRSLHIGLNGVNSAAYAGWPGTLGGCENDARTMSRIAQQEGFETQFLLTANATSLALLEAVKEAANSLVAGDVFWLTYSGHGGQVPNPEEADGKDETWVLYDRMFTDNELSAAFSQFRVGVNLVLVSDSCHSGTVYRDVPSAAAMRARARAGVRVRVIPYAVVQAVMAGGWTAPRARAVPIAANGLALNACQDEQLAQEVGGAGIFTTQLVRCWDGGRYNDDYPTFLEQIAANMPRPKEQTPQYGTFGADPESLAARTPFKLREGGRRGLNVPRMRNALAVNTASD